MAVSQYIRQATLSGMSIKLACEKLVNQYADELLIEYVHDLNGVMHVTLGGKKNAPPRFGIVTVPLTQIMDRELTA